MSQVFDIGLDSDGDWPLFPVHITGTDLVLQRVAIRMGNNLGEWLLNKFDGLPKIRWMTEKPLDVDRAGAEVRREIETTPGVQRVIRFSAVYDSSARKITFTGRIIVENEELDFEVTPREVSGELDTVNQTPMAVFFRSGHIVASF